MLNGKNYVQNEQRITSMAVSPFWYAYMDDTRSLTFSNVRTKETTRDVVAIYKRILFI